MPAVLAAEGLCVADARGRALVCDVDLAVEPGQTVALVGESGSGKTLTARAALGLVPATCAVTAGRVVLDGVDVLAAAPREHRRLLGTRVGYVPQNTVAYLQPSLRVGTQMTDGLLTWNRAMGRDAARHRACELLVGVGLREPDRVMASYPGELSGGMRQRVNIAMALMGDPCLLVADEPTAALDSVTRRQVMDLLDGVARERGLALLMVSHDLGLVRRHCSHVYVMYAGRVVERGPVAAVAEKPGHPYTAALLAAAPQVGADPARRLADIPGAMPADGRDAARCTFAPRCPRACAACTAGLPAFAQVDAGEPDHEAACVLLRGSEGGVPCL